MSSSTLAMKRTAQVSFTILSSYSTRSSLITFIRYHLLSYHCIYLMEGRADDEEPVLFKHEELMEITSSTLRELIAGDELLSYLPEDVTAEEVASELALKHGQSMSLNLHKENGHVWKIVVQKGGRVIDLKHAIRRCVMAQLGRNGVTRKISWRYVWRTNHLSFEGQVLDDDRASLLDLGLQHKSDIYFVKR